MTGNNTLLDTHHVESGSTPRDDLKKVCIKSLHNSTTQVVKNKIPLIEEKIKAFSQIDREVCLGLNDISNESEKIVTSNMSTTCKTVKQIETIINRRRAVKQCWGNILTELPVDKSTLDSLAHSIGLSLSTIPERINQSRLGDARLELSTYCKGEVNIDPSQMVNEIKSYISQKEEAIYQTAKLNISNEDLCASVLENIISVTCTEVSEKINNILHLINEISIYSRETLEMVRQIQNMFEITTSKGSNWGSGFSKFVRHRVKNTVSQASRDAANVIANKTVEYSSFIGSIVGIAIVGLREATNISKLGLEALRDALFELPNVFLSALDATFESVGTVVSTLVDAVEVTLPIILVLTLYGLIGFAGTSIVSAVWNIAYNFITNTLLPFIALHISNVFVI